MVVYAPGARFYRGRGLGVLVEWMISEYLKILCNIGGFTMEKNVHLDYEAMVRSEKWEDRLKAARAGVGLEELIDDKFWVVRSAVAEQGYGLERLVNDPHFGVRAEVAKQGYGLDVLVHDKDWFVRKVVAEQGYGYDILRKDEERMIRDLAKKMHTASQEQKSVEKPLDEKLAEAQRIANGVGCKGKQEKEKALF